MWYSIAFQRSRPHGKIQVNFSFESAPVKRVHWNWTNDVKIGVGIDRVQAFCRRSHGQPTDFAFLYMTPEIATAHRPLSEHHLRTAVYIGIISLLHERKKVGSWKLQVDVTAKVQFNRLNPGDKYLSGRLC